MSKNTLLFVLVCVGLLAALFSFVQRYRAESHNRRVELVIDWPDAQALANTTHLPIDSVLARFRNAGITTVAITEDTLDNLRAGGILTFRRDGSATILTFAPGFAAQQARVAEMLTHKTGLVWTRQGMEMLRVDAPWLQFYNLPVGLDDEAVQTVRRNKLLIAPRLVNYTGVTAQNIAWELAQTRAQCTAADTGPFIFAGSDVLGNRGLIRTTADVIQADQLVYGTVEFSKTIGDDDLTRLAADRTVRVHSIGHDEIGTMDEPTAIERFVRAARERNIRVCYIRFFANGLKGEPDVITANLDFVRQVVKGLSVARLTVGQAHPFESDPAPSLLGRLVMSVGVIAGVVMLLRLFLGLTGKAFWITLGTGLLAGALLAAPSHNVKGREILALLAACTFPTLGLCYRSLDAERTAVKAALRSAFLEYARITLATLAGILFIVGLLSGRLFLLKIDAFFGVKAVLVTPVLLVFAYYSLGLSSLRPRDGWAMRRARIAEALGALAGQPLRVGQLVFGLIALAALAFFVARSGNDPGVGVSATELKMRALLDKYLFVRPRTKEFLLGHPALFFALAAAFTGRYKKWLLPLLVIGAIGQSSLVDTFCHLHTPLFISLLHALIGWALGGIIGALAFAIIEKYVPRKAMP